MGWLNKATPRGEKTMTKHGLAQEEKILLTGMLIPLNLDLCMAFQCPDEGCDECPFAKMIEAHNKFITAVEEVITGE